MIGQAGTCRAETCRAPIQWARTTKGKRIPLDPAPSATGNIRLEPVLDDLPEAVVLAGRNLDAARGRLEELYVSHFATCPARQGFRR